MARKKIGAQAAASQHAQLPQQQHAAAAAAAAVGDGSEFYSIKGQFAGATVLLTGASGYIGGVVLEQLLRTTDVAAVYLLLRPRRGADVRERVSTLLQSSLFHLVRDRAHIVSKVRAVAGDIQAPGLGLSASDCGKLAKSVDFIVHCAADIRLEPTIQETLVANFEGTRAVLELAAACAHLKALVHVSSCFVNVNRPRSSVVAEQLYPLRFGEQAVDAEDVAAELMGLPSGDADMRATVYMRRWKFPNTYTLGKHLTEHLVAKYQARLGLPVAIVRPSLVSAVAGAPYPGYSGNWAGCIGAGAAMAIGLFDCLASVASHPLGVWDIVPADLVGSAIIAAAAAVAGGVAAGISRATGSGALAPADAVSHHHRHHHHHHHRHVHHHKLRGGGGGGSAAADSASAGSGSPTASVARLLRSGKAYPAASLSGDDGSDSAASGATRGPSSGGGGSSASLSDASGGGDDGPRPFGARLFARGGGIGGGGGNNSGAFAQSAAAPAVAAPPAADDGAAGLPLLVVHAATSSTYPLTLMEGWNYNLEFFAAHPPPFSITPGCLPRMTDAFAPDDARVMARRRWTGWKVWAICSLLRMFGRHKEARKLEVGFETFCVHNNSKTDRDLTFSTTALVALEARLAPAERGDYLLVWRPMPATAGSAGGAAGVHPCRLGGALAGVRGDMCWRRYCHTQMAGIYRMLFAARVPALAPMRHAVGGGALPAGVLAAAAEAAAAITEGRERGKEREAPAALVDYLVSHDFVAVR